LSYKNLFQVGGAYQNGGALQFAAFPSIFNKRMAAFRIGKMKNKMAFV
jgi:hypothetical protein